MRDGILSRKIAGMALGLMFLSSCASMFIVKSDPPQADVFFLDPKSGQKKALGKTPFEMKSTLLKETIGPELLGGEYFTVLVEAKGFQTESFLIPSSRFGTLVTELDVKMKAGEQEKEAKVAKEILDHLFLAQRLALLKEYERAQMELDPILKQFPEFPRALSLRGSIYFMQRNLDEALIWYEKALAADPQMDDAIRMTAKIRELKGQAGQQRFPASTPASTPVGGPTKP